MLHSNKKNHNCNRYVKKLPANQSPFLNKQLKCILSLFDRCVEHLEEETFKKLLEHNEILWNNLLVLKLFFNQSTKSLL